MDEESVSHIFRTAAEKTPDQYWQNILKDCAKKKYPRGFEVINGFIYAKKSRTKVEIPNDPEAACRVSITFFREIGNMASYMDITNTKHIYIDKEDLTAKKILSTPKLLHACLKEYIYSKEGNRGADEFLETLGDIYLGRITHESIVVQENRIIDIQPKDIDPKFSFTDGFPPTGNTRKKKSNESNWANHLASVSHRSSPDDITIFSTENLFSPREEEDDDEDEGI